MSGAAGERAGATLVVPGTREPLAEGPVPLARPAAEALAELGLDLRVADAVVVGAARGAAAREDVALAPDAVVELALDGGSVVYVRADALPERLRLAGARGEAALPDTIELPLALPLGEGGERGIGGWAIRAVRVLVLGDRDPVAAAAPLVARRLGEALEAKQVPRPGLRRWAGGALEEVAGVLEPGDAPWLLFLHGTASSTMGSFGALLGSAPGSARAAEWRELAARYGERILALEHRTLTVSPARNAIEVLERLPAGATLDMVSHSRGGLVGELLCRGQLVGRDGTFSDEELAAFPEEGRAELEELGALLARKRPVVRRFVRVACPARGTILASERLDGWLNVALNALGLVVRLAPSLALTEAYDVFKTLTIAVVKEKADAATLPGLEAMVPGHPLVALLNQPGVETTADLSVIAGDIEGGGLLERLKVFATDLFFRTDHDLVVNTGAMTGGMPRAMNLARQFPVQGPQVNHFSYFRNTDTAAQVVKGLLRADADMAGFVPMPVSGDREIRPAEALRGVGSRPVVFVLPGIMGSHLEIGGRRVWLDPVRLAGGGLRGLRVGLPSITATAPVGLFYGALCDRLARTHEVRPWAYDWRLSVETAGARLAAELRHVLDTTDQPVRIVAHSLGGLVARAALLDAELWKAMRAREGSRLVLLGTPCGGSHVIPMILLGRDRTLRSLAMLDLTATMPQLLEVVAAFPALHEMLPRDPGFDLFDRRSWEALAARVGEAGPLTLPTEKQLAEAGEVQQRLRGAPVDPARMFYIAGRAPTPERILLTPTGGLAFAMTEEGDGRVPWSTGVPPGMRAFYAEATHGDLARDPKAIEAITELLQTGATAMLGETAPRRRGALPPPPIARETPTIQPDFAELAAAALGGTRPVEKAAAPRVRITVIHGHVAMADHPVMVGHYEGDTIAGAEGVLDQLFDGRLSRRKLLGLYPEARGTAEVVLDRRRRPEGAVVLGMGTPGELSRSLLEDVYATGFLRYAAAEEEEWCTLGEPELRRHKLATVLIGAGEGGLSRHDAVLALVGGLRRAMEARGRDGLCTELQVVEMFEARATETWHQLRALAKEDPEGLGAVIDLADTVQKRDGASRRPARRADPSWWQPVQITMEPERGATGASDLRLMNFSSPSGRARVEASLQAFNAKIVELFSLQAPHLAGLDPAMGTPGRVLFEMLWPDRLKDRSAESRNLRLILDRETAALPWEMMDDRRPWDVRPGGTERKPPAVRAGVVRQLAGPRFRDRPKALPREKKRALVIGNPIAVPAPGFGSLPGAEREAELVKAKLEAAGYGVEALIGRDATPDRILSALFADAWSVVHVAAHGAVRHRFGNGPERTGVILGGEFVLGPEVLERMPVPPELAFVNCCHVGQVDAAGEAARARNHAWPQLAATVSVQLIEMGARAVVAAGWAVDDAAALDFAARFYDAMLSGEGFGDAVKQAREAIHDNFGYSTTWGAYQCYGEADWRLAGDGPLPEAPGEQPFAARVEAIEAIEAVLGDAEMGVARDTVALRASLDGIVERARGGFAKEARVAALLGDAFAALDDLEKALEWYDRALDAPVADLPMRAIEGRANLLSRLAIRRFEADGEKTKARTAIQGAIEQLGQVIALAGASGERHVLLGACHKRLAQVSAGRARLAALRRMAAEYGAAVDAADAEAGPYHRLMKLTAETILGLLEAEAAPATAAAELAEIRAAAERCYAASGAFYDAVTEADCELLAFLVGTAAGGSGSLDAVERLYARARRRNGSPFKMRASLDHFGFFVAVLGDAKSAFGAQALAIRQLRERLDAQMSAGGGRRQ